MINIVELAADKDDCAFDQPCKYGHRVEGHAVYCHNELWADSPRKCRRTWYTGGETKDEDCPGFEANPEYVGPLNPTAIDAPCVECKGKRIVPRDKWMETCDHCAGGGVEPQFVALSAEEQNILESGCMRRQPYVVCTDTQERENAIMRLSELSCVDVESVTWAAKGVRAYLLHLTGYGHATLRLCWADADQKENQPGPVR